MRILLVINEYPPLTESGYGLLCGEAVEEFWRRGHEVLVLTGLMGCDGKRRLEQGVWRIFEFCRQNKANELRSASLADVWHWYRERWIEHGLISRAFRIFRPDVLYVWTTWGLAASVGVHLMRLPVPKAAYVCASFFAAHNKRGANRREYAFWQWGREGLRGKLKTLVAKMLQRRVPLDFEPLLFDRVAFNTQQTEAYNDGLHVSRTPPVRILDSAPVERLADLPVAREQRRRLLFLGRIEPIKDPLTLIAAVSRLQQELEYADLSLTIAGWWTEAEYRPEIEELIAASPRPQQFHFLDPVPYEQMRELLGAHDVLVTPSRFDPLPRVVVEGMAAGMPVVLSDECGIRHHLEDGQEALVFRMGNVEDLVEKLRCVMADEAFASTLAEAGRKRALSYFSTARMIDEMVAFLAETIEMAGTHGHIVSPSHATISGVQHPARRN